MKIGRFSILVAILVAIFVAGSVSGSMAHEVNQPVKLDKPKISNLLTNPLNGTDGLEVIMSHVVLPPNVTLPKHWHPGEEFAYVLQGSVTLILEGKDERVISQGETGAVPLKHIHTARSGDQGVTILVFRVHEKGQPGRVLAKE